MSLIQLSVHLDPRVQVSLTQVRLGQTPKCPWPLRSHPARQRSKRLSCQCPSTADFARVDARDRDRDWAARAPVGPRGAVLRGAWNFMLLSSVVNLLLAASGGIVRTFQGVVCWVRESKTLACGRPAGVDVSRGMICPRVFR